MRALAPAFSRGQAADGLLTATPCHPSHRVPSNPRRRQAPLDIEIADGGAGTVTVAEAEIRNAADGAKGDDDQEWATETMVLIGVAAVMIPMLLMALGITLWRWLSRHSGTNLEFGDLGDGPAEAGWKLKQDRRTRLRQETRLRQKTSMSWEDMEMSGPEAVKYAPPPPPPPPRAPPHLPNEEK